MAFLFRLKPLEYAFLDLAFHHDYCFSFGEFLVTLHMGRASKMTWAQGVANANVTLAAAKPSGALNNSKHQFGYTTVKKACPQPPQTQIGP